MEMTDLSLYTDAIACLQHTINEGSKKSNVDIRLMLCQVHHCQAIVLELLQSEHEAIYSASLKSLQASLECHEKTLSKKIGQLSQSQTEGQLLQVLTTPTSAVEDHDAGFLPGLMPTSPMDVQEDSACAKRTTGLPREGSKKTIGGSKGTLDTDGMTTEGQCSQSRQSAIESTIVAKGQVRFADVIGLNEAKQCLYDAIIMPLVFPHLFTGGCRPWQRILLYGPPGTGKSYLAQAVASEVKATFYRVSSTDLMSSWVGESEKLIKELFQHANNRIGRSVIFIDEIDSLCRRRNSREEEGSRRIKTELLLQMDGQKQVLLLGATNCPWDLDTAFLRRFQRRIYVPLPDQSARVDIVKAHCKDHVTDLSDSDWLEIAVQTHGYSGSDLATLTTGAILQPIRELQKTTRWTTTEDGQWKPCAGYTSSGIQANWSDLPGHKISPRTVTKADFLTSLRSHHSTVSGKDLKLYEDFTSSFGHAM